MKYIIVIVLLLLCSPLQAGDATLSWTPPIETQTCVNAGPLTNLAGFKIYQMIADIADPSVTTLVVPNLKPGTHTFVSTAYDDQGVESMLSGAADKVITEFVTVSPTVYYVIQQPDKFILLPIGTLPIGTTCDPEQSVNDFYGVPRDQVTWTGTAQPFSVVAACG